MNEIKIWNSKVNELTVAHTQKGRGYPFTQWKEHSILLFKKFYNFSVHFCNTLRVEYSWNDISYLDEITLNRGCSECSVNIFRVSGCPVVRFPRFWRRIVRAVLCSLKPNFKHNLQRNICKSSLFLYLIFR